MTFWRALTLFGILVAHSNMWAGPAQAQQGYGFGIRFPNINFRTAQFKRFSFQGYGFTSQSAQPIQFSNIGFPVSSSRGVRRDFNNASNETRRGEQPIDYRPRASRTARLDRRTDFGRSARFSRTRPLPLNLARSARAGVRGTLSTVRAASGGPNSRSVLRLARSRADVISQSASRQRETRPRVNIRTASRLRSNAFSQTAIR